MFKPKTLIKICGITSLEQALQISQLGVDAIGIISVVESHRFLPHKNKNKIFRSLEEIYPSIKRVSVYKNAPLSTFIKNPIFSSSENVLQLHGDEDIEYCKRIKSINPSKEIWKAFRIKEKKDLEKIKPFENFIDAILLDSWNAETYGGSGKRIKSKYLEDLSFSKPWWLAGGISINWIDEILRNIKPNGLDISSSIEISPGIKDINKTNQIIEEIQK